MGQIYYKKQIKSFCDKNIDFAKKCENFSKTVKKDCDFFY